MRRSIALICALSCASFAWGQESETTSASSQTSGDADLISQLWNVEDATPLAPGELQLRLSGDWATGQHLGDSSDDWAMAPSIVWGVAQDWELSLTNRIWLGDGGDMGPFQDGNYDTNLGILWRLHEQMGFEHQHGYLHLPSIALSSTIRIPTGDGSSGVDAELRLILTHEYTSGIRTHLNGYVKSANGDNFELDADNAGNFNLDPTQMLELFSATGGDGLTTRDYQYGAVIGADGPLCDNGAVRWVADYMYRTSAFDQFSALHVGEVGVEWELSAVSKVGFAVQASLDHNDSEHQWGAGFAYTYAIGA